jgi:uncharacterized membrane protein
MSGILWIHIAAGLVALVCGTVAAILRKGGGAHGAAGTGFCVAMLVLGITAAILSPFKSPPESPVSGLMVCYFVATAWMAARRRSGVPGWFEKIACVLILAMAAAIIGHGLEVALAPPGQFPRTPAPAVLFTLGAICLLAGVLDVRFIRRGKLTTTQRISRHLWRICFAFFIATGSFFLGQQDVLPQALRGSPMLFILAFAPFALMLFWLLRLRLSRRPLLKQPASLPVEE